jgi:hypothetical protein
MVPIVRPPRPTLAVVALVVLAAGAVAALAGCASAEHGGGTVPVPTPTPVPSGGVELAPSQTGADTVAPPDTPDPCRLDDLELWTARVVVGTGSADAVIRVRNAGREWCEVDVSGSPVIDPAIEPDVWLDPGGWADLVVGQRDDGPCAGPEVVATAAVVVGGETVDVPTAAVAACSWWLTAFYPQDDAADSCVATDLELTVVTPFVLVRNRAPVACRLGALVGVRGVDVASADLDEVASVGPATPAILDLAPGDVAGFPATWDPRSQCDHELGDVILEFADAGDVRAQLPRCARYQLGPGRPWFGDRDGPPTVPTPATGGVAGVLRTLDPFAGGAP